MIEPRAGLGKMQGLDARRDNTRDRLASIALGGLVVVILVVLIGGWLVRGDKPEAVIQILTATTSILTGIVGAIVGFYFKENKRIHKAH